MPYAADLLIERLKEQIQLAPQLRENEEPGGTCVQMADRLTEGMNRAGHIVALKAVEGGKKRYERHFEVALKHVMELSPLFAAVANMRATPWASELQRDKAMAAFKDTPAKIISICKAAISEMEGASKLLDEGERRETRTTALASK